MVEVIEEEDGEEGTVREVSFKDESLIVPKQAEIPQHLLIKDSQHFLSTHIEK